MPATHRVPELTFHSASGRARVRLGGRRVHLGKHGSPETIEKSHRLIVESLRTGQVPEEAAPPSSDAVASGVDSGARTVGEVVLAYRRWAEGDFLKDGEPMSELSSLKQSLKAPRSLDGSTPAGSSGPKTLKAVRDAAVIGRGLSRGGASRRAAHVKRLFRWAVAEELVPPQCTTV